MPLFPFTLTATLDQDPYRLIVSLPMQSYSYNETYISVASGTTEKRTNLYKITGSNEPCAWSETFNPSWMNIWPVTSGVQCPFEISSEVESLMGPRKSFISKETWNGYESWFRIADNSVHRRDSLTIVWSFEK